ncbi:MAG TPA: nuclear transport factor 2 family protein [Solirubrobacterales bacterium]|nr:nuclear transport factor 2 family protein [Solirubrobacterales bacterium]
MASRADVDAWVAAYERAWRTAGTESLRDRFTDDATYRMSPYAEPAIGLDEIAALWEGEREGPDEPFEMRHEIVAVEGDTAVVRVEVTYGEPRPGEYRDLWIVRLAPDGRCRAFEEWPFWPGQKIDPSEEGR